MLAFRFFLTPLIVAFAFGGATIAMSADRRPGDDATRIREAVAHGRILPLPRILAVAQHRIPGEVLRAELEEVSDRFGYSVKILTPDGRVREIRLDAQTAAILAVQDD